jgi:DNA-directed RNA polymerase sigma subunit (sigma70/sigma32)
MTEDELAEAADALHEIEELRAVLGGIGPEGGLLTPQEIAVLRLRYGITEEGAPAEPLSARETSTALGLHHDGARRLEKEALRKLREALG